MKNNRFNADCRNIGVKLIRDKSWHEELARQNSDVWMTQFETLYHPVQINPNTEQAHIHEKLYTGY